MGKLVWEGGDKAKQVKRLGVGYECIVTLCRAMSV